jgi:chemotaxis protein CheD
MTDFSKIRRMRDARFPHEVATILPGEFFVSDTPMVVYTLLGSCVSACIRDPIARVGGMNHFMLPAPKHGESHNSWGESTRYGSYAMELLINEILQRGGLKSRLEIKLFGGGRIYDGNVDVGANNATWVLEYLTQEGLSPLKADLGDVCPRKVYYFTDSGRVLLKKLDRVTSRTLVDREKQYQETLEKQPVQGDVTLF